MKAKVMSVEERSARCETSPEKCFRRDNLLEKPRIIFYFSQTDRHLSAYMYEYGEDRAYRGLFSKAGGRGISRVKLSPRNEGWLAACVRVGGRVSHTGRAVKCCAGSGRRGSGCVRFIVQCGLSVAEAGLRSPTRKG